MMALPITPFISFMFSVFFMLAIVQFSPALASFLGALAGLSAVFIYLRRSNRLPGWVMDILERFTDKAALEKAYAERRRRTLTIDADALYNRLRLKVVGQDQTLKSLSLQLRRRLTAQRVDKPIAVFCFAGPSGIGKTHLAKTMANEVFGAEHHLKFFDMSQFSQPHAAASLFGQAKGYVGSTSYGSLTAALRDQPDSIILLDEFEKAHPEVHKRFLTAWNDGFVTETSDGTRIATNEAIFILTTNAASRRIGEIARSVEPASGDQQRLIKQALADVQFAPEVLSRIDEVFAFAPLAGLDIARVVALELERLAAGYNLRIMEGGIAIPILLSAIEKMEGRADGGVRDIARYFERKVTDGLIDARSSGADAVRLEIRDEQIVIFGYRFGLPLMHDGSSAIAAISQ